MEELGRTLRTLWQSSDWFGRATGCLALVIFGFTLLTALAPPLKFDALVYHLALPRQYLLAGRMDYVPQIMFWGMPQTAEMLYTWAMSLGGEPAAVVTGWLVGLVALFGLLGLIARSTGCRTGLGRSGSVDLRFHPGNRFSLGI